MPGRKVSVKPNLRRAEIIERVNREGEVSVDELSRIFTASAETVRRDLNNLAAAGQLRKIHGGAMRIASTVEGSFDERLGRNRLAKQVVAEKLAGIVSPDQSLFMDTGSTTLICAEALGRVPNLTVITNSTQIAKVVSEGAGERRIILLGGTYRNSNSQTVGPSAIAEVARFRPDHAIIAIGTLDARGAADYSEEEAEVARAMIDAAANLTVVADSSKLNRRTTYHVCALDEIDTLILERPPGGKLGKALKSAGVDVL